MTAHKRPGEKITVGTLLRVLGTVKGVYFLEQVFYCTFTVRWPGLEFWFCHLPPGS